MQGMWVRSQVGGLGFHMPCGQKKQNINNIITDSIKTFKMVHIKKKKSYDFPGGSVVKNLLANAGDTNLIPDPGRSHMPRGS